MAPKQKPLSAFGSIQEHGHQFRATTLIYDSCDVVGVRTYGPSRETRAAAEADLAHARQASSRDEMNNRLLTLKGNAAVAFAHGAASNAPTSGVKQPAAFRNSDEDAQPRGKSKLVFLPRLYVPGFHGQDLFQRGKSRKTYLGLAMAASLRR